MGSVHLVPIRGSVEGQVAGEACYLVYEHPESINVTGECWSESPFSGSEDFGSRPIYRCLRHGENVKHDGVQSEIREASTWWFLIVYQNICLRCVQWACAPPGITRAHPTNVPVHLFDPMQVPQAVCYVGQLRSGVNSRSFRGGGGAPTKVIRFTSGFFRVKSRIFPFSIHGETMQNGKVDSEVPWTGTMFG